MGRVFVKLEQRQLRVFERAGWSAVLTALIVLSGCFSELQGASCETDQECFRDELCIETKCRVVGADSGEPTSNMMDTSGSGQTFISGSVYNAFDNQPLPDVTVNTIPLSEIRRTNEFGQFQLSIPSVSSPQYTLYFKRYGFEDKILQVSVVEGTSSSAIAVMSPCTSDEEICGNGEDDDCDGIIDEGVTNGCNGCEPLPRLGEACGFCSGGVYVCKNEEEVKCAGEPELNECGGCDSFIQTVGDSCGLCDRGEYVCASVDNEDSAVVCEIGDPQLNACGGCSELTAQPGEICGTCGNYQCNGLDAVACAAAEEICGNDHDDDCTGGVDDGCE